MDGNFVVQAGAGKGEGSGEGGSKSEGKGSAMSMSDLPSLQLWDFGGQEVFYPTHQFFLTLRAIYLIVFRLDDAKFISNLDYWVHVIRVDFRIYINIYNLFL